MRDDDDPDGQRHGGRGGPGGMGGPGGQGSPTGAGGVGGIGGQGGTGASFRENMSRAHFTPTERFILIVGAFSATATAIADLMRAG